MLTLDEQNRYRELYRAQHPTWQPATERFAAEVMARLHSGSRVLDLGCGRGGLVEQLPTSGPVVMGIDPDWESLLTHRIPTLPRVAGFSHDLPFVAGSFELVYATWLLEHLAWPELTLREISRVLCDGGAFVFVTPNARHPLSAINRTLGQLGQWQQALVNRVYGRAGDDTFPTRYQANTAADLERVAGMAGLRLTHLTFTADPTYLAFTPALFQFMTRAEALLPKERHIHLVGVMEK